jgi:cell division protein FtsL
MDAIKNNRVFEFAENHPYILLGIILVLVIMVVYMYMQSRGYKVPGTGKAKSKKSSTPETEEDELDDLIEAIHDKQRTKKE